VLIPIIMVSNMLLVWVFSVLKNQKYWTKALVAVVLKTVFLFLCGVLAAYFVNDSVLIKIAATMFSWMQGVTGILGAGLAYGVVRSLRTR